MWNKPIVMYQYILHIHIENDTELREKRENEMGMDRWIHIKAFIQ
uniref:Uncharacterized protein n=1 Tax=Amphimedon queenslandica TaxID=400682 RepID=A0A1X7U7Z3_AMPQE